MCISYTKQKIHFKTSLAISLVDKTHVGSNFDRDQNNKKHKTQKSKLKEIFF